MSRRVRSYQNVVKRLQKISFDSPLLSLNQLGVLSPWGKAVYPFYMVSLEHPRSKERRSAKKISLSAGIHGNEPSGVEAVLAFLESHREKELIDRGVQLLILPCINPFGFEHDTRENAGGIDLNRQFRKRKPSKEVKMARQALGPKPYHVSLEFHEDIDTHGFYLYEMTQDGEKGWGRKIINALAKQYPINRDPWIDGLKSRRGIISRRDITPSFDQWIRKKKDWPQAFLHYSRGTPRCITSETPVHLPMKKRVDMHLTTFEIILKSLN